MTPDGFVGRRRLVVGLASATQAASGGMLGTALVVYVGRSGSPFAVSMLASAFFASSMVFSPLWGAVGDLFGRRRTLVPVATLTAVATFAFLLADGVWGLVGLRAVRSVFAVGFGPLALSLVRALTATERRGRAVGFVSSASAAGDVGAQLAVGVLLGALAPSSLYVLVGALALLTVALVVFFEEPAGAVSSTVGNPTAARPTLRAVAANVRGRLVPDAAERRRLRRTGLTWLYAGIALRHLAVQGVGSLVPVYLVGRLGLPTAAMGVLLASNPAAQVLLLSVFGSLADRGARKRMVVAGIVLSGCYTLVLAGASLAATPAARGLAAAGAFVVLATGFSAMDMGTVAVIGDHVPESRESAFVGLRSTAAGVGGVLGPALVGGAATAVGFPTAFALASAFAFAAAVVVAAGLREPVRTTIPPTDLGTVETTAGIAQLPGAHRGSDGD